MFADELIRIDRAYALDSAFAKEIHRTIAEGRTANSTSSVQKAERSFRDPGRYQRRIGYRCEGDLIDRARVMREKLRLELKEEYTREGE